MAVSPGHLLMARKFPTYQLTYTGTTQDIVAPGGAQFLVVDLAGAQGGGAAGGKGGRLQAVLPISGGATLHVNVGQQGQHGAGGWNGGGDTTSGVDQHADPVSGYGGGGATDIRIGGTALADRKLVAGAGGAGSGPNAGGVGGGVTAGNAQRTLDTALAAGGGTQAAGGAGGTSTFSPPQGEPGSAGTLGTGGASGVDTDGVVAYEPGGGGGGYYGGGGGLYDVGASGGGGGGSSYADPSATDVVHTQGSQPGNGYAILSFR